MNVYEATLKAADWIETNPGLWKYSAVTVPDCKSPGCALGWIGHFMGRENFRTHQKGRTSVGIVAEKALDINAGQFYTRMWKLERKWRGDPMAVAKCLRLYAEKYLKPEQAGHIPREVRAIFKSMEAA